MSNSLPNFKNAKLLVIGDIMLDRYWHGGTSRISPEAPVPVVHVKDIEERPGGAGNVAYNLATLGCSVSLIAQTGKDEVADSLNRILSEVGVSCDFVASDDVPTITKLRILSRHQQLIRLDFEEKLHEVLNDELLSAFRKDVESHNVVLLSDYGKGTLNGVSDMIDITRQANKRVLVDPKGSNFSIYRNASVITPNFSEFAQVVGDCDSEQAIEERARNLANELNLEAMLVTRGEHGMSLIPAKGSALHIPTRAREVYDVTGAGDTVISVMAAALACDESLEDATVLANVAAGIVVGKLGTAAITESELRLALKEDQEHDLGVVNKPDLLAAIKDAKARGEKIIMTNGCFDILHAGHVSYLEQARQLGDRLIVAVNSDESVRRLKGEKRPIVPLEQRMAVLAGLASVDWVVEFGDDTPQELICDLLPDILVKGGDYQAEDVAGYDCVTKNGGEVRILNFVDGVSTSKIVKEIIESH